MVVPQHEAEWPDKAVFAATVLTFAAFLGTGYALLRLTNASFGENIPALFQDWPVGIMLPASLVALVFGILAMKHHSALFLYLGAVAAVVSLAFVGLVPLLAVLAVGFMVKAHIEGEDTTLRTDVPDVWEWPDKAMRASSFLFIGAIITLFQGILTLTDRFSPILFDGMPWLWGSWSIVVGLFGLWGANQVFRLQRAWSGTVAAILCFLGFGLYLVGPALAIGALVALFQADKEEEFYEG